MTSTSVPFQVSANAAIENNEAAAAKIAKRFIVKLSSFDPYVISTLADVGVAGKLACRRWPITCQGFADASCRGCRHPCLHVPGTVQKQCSAGSRTHHR